MSLAKAIRDQDEVNAIDSQILDARMRLWAPGARVKDLDRNPNQTLDGKIYPGVGVIMKKEDPVDVLLQWVDPELGGKMPAEVRQATIAVLERLERLREALEAAIDALDEAHVPLPVKAAEYRNDALAAAKPEEQWVCSCNYMNIGPICTHCKRLRAAQPEEG